MNGTCPQPTVVVKNTSGCGRYFPQYKPCDECGYPKGYPKDYFVEVCVTENGTQQVYIARSEKTNNRSTPAFDNTDWILKTMGGWFKEALL